MNGSHVLFAWVNEAQTSKCFLSKGNEGRRVFAPAPSHGAPSLAPHQPSGLQGRQTSSSSTQPVPLGPAELRGNFRETGLPLPDKCLFTLAFLTQQAAAHSLVIPTRFFLSFLLLGQRPTP